MHVTVEGNEKGRLVSGENSQWASNMGHASSVSIYDTEHESACNIMLKLLWDS